MRHFRAGRKGIRFDTPDAPWHSTCHGKEGRLSALECPSYGRRIPACAKVAHCRTEQDPDDRGRRGAIRRRCSRTAPGPSPQSIEELVSPHMSEGSMEKKPYRAQTHDKYGIPIEIGNPINYLPRAGKVVEKCRVLRILQTGGSENGWMVITNPLWKRPKIVPPWKIESRLLKAKQPNFPQEQKTEPEKPGENVPKPRAFHHGALKKMGETLYRHCRQCGWVSDSVWLEHQGH